MLTSLQYYKLSHGIFVVENIRPSTWIRYALSHVRRYIPLILFFLVLITPFILRMAVGGSSKAVVSSAAGESVIIVTPHVEGIRREFADAFDHWHREKYGSSASVDYRSYGGTTDIVRYLDNVRDSGTFQKLGTYGMDLVWGGGDIFFETKLKKNGHLEGLTLPEAVMSSAFSEKNVGGLPLYDTGSPPQWFGTALSSFGIGFNRDVVSYLGVTDPKTWRDLADARWRGWIVMADPTRSSSAVAVYMTVVERAMQDATDAGGTNDDGWANGMGLLRQIAANARLFTDASSALPGQVSSGDVGAAMTIDFHSIDQMLQVGEARMGFILPANATILNPDPIAMLKGAPHPEMAKRFIEFVLSDVGQKLWYRKAGEPGGPVSTTLYRLPVRADLFQDDPELRKRADPFAAGGFNTSRKRTATFSFLPDLIQCSCMDTLEDLRAARLAITKAGRADLDAKLGKFPFDQKVALEKSKQLAALKEKPAERLALLRKWSEEFREEYRELREEAERTKN